MVAKPLLTWNQINMYQNLLENILQQNQTTVNANVLDYELKH